MTYQEMFDIVNQKERNIHISLRTTKDDILKELINKNIKLRKINIRLIQMQIRNLENGYQIIE